MPYCARIKEKNREIHPMATISTIKNLTGLALGLMVLVACDEASVIPEAPVRAIKPFYVAELAGGTIRSFNGTVASSGTSTLSFSVGGTINSIDVNAGDQVKSGQILATLDNAPYQLDVDAAKSQQNASKANLETQKSDLKRQKDLYERGWVAKVVYDQALLSYESAKEDLNYNQSKLSGANRNLSRTELSAPYDGVIATRTAEPFTEVTAGNPIFEINAKGALEVIMSIPDSLISKISIGLPVKVTSDQVANCGCQGRITEIGSIASAANAVTVKATLNAPPADLLPGVSTSVFVPMAISTDTDGYLLPLNAIAASGDSGEGYVFKFDQSSGTVSKVSIKGRAGRDNMIQITEGIAAGDIIAAAGVSFLRDGQKVKLLGQ